MTQSIKNFNFPGPRVEGIWWRVDPEAKRKCPPFSELGTEKDLLALFYYIGIRSPRHTQSSSHLTCLCGHGRRGRQSRLEWLGPLFCILLYIRSSSWKRAQHSISNAPKREAATSHLSPYAPAQIAPCGGHSVASHMSLFLNSILSFWRHLHSST